MEAPFRIRDATGTIKDCFESFPEALLTLNGHPMILEAVVASISYDLILCMASRHEPLDWLLEKILDVWKRPTSTRDLVSSPEPTRWELLTAKQFSRMLRKEKEHCYAVFLDETLLRSCMNGSDETLPYCLRHFLLNVLWITTLICCLVQSPSLKPLTAYPSFRPMRFRSCAETSLPRLHWPEYVRNYFPFPHTDVLIEKTQGFRIFSILDLWSAYYQVIIYPPDIYKTSFVTPFGHFEYLLVPFRFINALSIFQTLMNSLLGHLHFVSVYFDGILIFSKNKEERSDHLRQELN